MRSEKYILKNDIDINIEEINIPEFEDEEIELIEEYIEFTRHIQEIDQLFHVFKVNLNHLLIHYDLINNDTIIKKDNFANDEDDEIVINALVINYVSAGRTFVESIEVFLKERLGIEKYKEFKMKCLSKKYDEKFSYRFLYNLRNFSQHGHLPVYIEYNKCCFDLDQILFTPHFEHNKKLKNEMESIRKSIEKEFGDNPRIIFTQTIAEFQIVILEIYNDFIDFIINKLLFYKQSIDDLIKRRPDIIYNSNDAFNGFIMYGVKNDSLHCFNPRENPNEMIEVIKQKLLDEYKNSKNEFEQTFKMKVIKEINYKK